MRIGDILAGGDVVTELMLPEYEVPTTHEEWVLCSPDKAREFLKFNTFDNQRKLSPTKVTHYSKQMKDGDWVPGADGDAKIARTGSGDWELMDAQHRFHAIIEAGLTVPIKVTWYTFKSEQNKYKFFASIDQGAKRTEADALRALGVKNVLSSMDGSTIRTATAALKSIELNFKGKGSRDPYVNPNTSSINGVKRVIEAFADPLMATSDALHGSKALTRRTMNAPCFGIALLTYVYAPEAAQEFWPIVVDPNTLEKGTPIYALHHYLLTENTVSRADDYVFHIANAWNAYAEGRGMDYLKRGSNQVNVRIACTPMDGKNPNAGREIIASRLAQVK